VPLLNPKFATDSRHGCANFGFGALATSTMAVAQLVGDLEATPGIEPGYTVLQTVA
jgi:hypothetical protein